MQQIFQAYTETILRLGREYGPRVAAVVMAFLAGLAVLRAVARVRVGRGPGAR
jgi:hypothetical protein